jgi:ribosomal protein S18 acetylase RimI-like enzyme
MWRGQDIGFFELVAQRRGVKIEGFGLLPLQRGRGFGSALLTHATAEAFRLGATRVWLHTATDDHPSALQNYLARGFSVYREQELKNPMPTKAEANRSAA